MNAQGTIDLWIGPDLESVVARCSQDISQQLNHLPSITLSSDTKDPNTHIQYAARQLANALRHQDTQLPASRIISVIQPDDIRSRLAASLGLATKYRSVAITAPGARYNKLRLRRDVAEAQALIGVGSIGPPGSPGLLAIGLWTNYVDPRLSIPLLHPARREPTTADIALAISPTLAGTLLIADHRGYVVCAWARDLVAAELAGLGLWTASVLDHHDRIGPWEDPVVQRATELDLGVQLPSDLTLHPVWTGDADDGRGIGTLDALASTIATLLNIDAAEFPSR